VFQLLLADTGKVAVFIEEVAHTAGSMPVSVFINGVSGHVAGSRDRDLLMNTAERQDHLCVEKQEFSNPGRASSRFEP
jgi:hypothetical protein